MPPIFTERVKPTFTLGHVSETIQDRSSGEEGEDTRKGFGNFSFTVFLIQEAHVVYWPNSQMLGQNPTWAEKPLNELLLEEAMGLVGQLSSETHRVQHRTAPEPGRCVIGARETGVAEVTLYFHWQMEKSTGRSSEKE